MDVEAATDEIPFNAMSCSSLIEISNLQEESENFPSKWKLLQMGIVYGIIKVRFIINEYKSKKLQAY